MNDIKDKVNNIMNILDTINYGFLDNDGNNIFDDKDSEDKFNQVYYLLSPDELLNKKVGVCWDQVELERKLFNESNIECKTYFIYLDDNNYLPSHTFLVFKNNGKFYWFEHSWYDYRGIYEYNTLNELLIDIEDKFRDSKKDEVDSNLDIHIYDYLKPKYNINCDEFYQYIHTQKEVICYKLVNCTNNDLDRIKLYKYNSIVSYADNLSNNEINEIKDYINKSIMDEILNYKNIIVNNNVVGSILINSITEGYLIDEIYIKEDYRNKGIGSLVITDFINSLSKDIYLWVYKNNINAIRLYNNLGFIVLSETDNRYYMKCSKEVI